jgi:hypothetical protein
MKILSLVIMLVLVSSSSGMIAICGMDKNIAVGTLDREQKAFLQPLETEFSVKLSDCYFLEYEEYNLVTFDEAVSYTNTIGKPMLPSVIYVFTFPLGTVLEDVDVMFSETTIHTASKKIIPFTSSALGPTATESNYNKIDSAIYSSSKIYPQERFCVQQGAGLENQEHVAIFSVECYPLRYMPADNVIEMSHRLDITIKCGIPGKVLIDVNEYDMVIIAPDEFSSALEPLIDHKNSYGIQTYLETTEKIYGSYNGRDEPEQIKQFIKYAIENDGIHYVLLVGDIEKIPIRMSAISWYDFDELPTDLYYADVFNADASFCTWDSNGNNRFGEFTWNMNNGEVLYVDDVDMFPDVGLGRLPCENTDTVATVVEKIIDYETGSYGQDWFNRIILLGGDTFPGWGVNEGEVVTGYISEVMAEFTPTKLWTSLGSFKPWLINRELTTGAGFVSYSGHGYEYGFGTSPPDRDRRIQYYTPYLMGVKNGNRLPIVFFDACLTATVDLYLGGFHIPGFAWSIVKKSGGGAIASIGATRVAYASVMNDNIQAGAPRLNANFFENYEQGALLSGLFVGAQNDYLNYCWKDCLTLEEFNLIGDPSLKIGGYP